MKSMIALLAFFSSSVFALSSGKTAPDFTLPSAPKGETVKLSDYKGKIIVLEWTNNGCPFVKKHYESHNMQNLQKKYTDKGVVWLSIVSSAPGKQGYVTAEEAQAVKEKNHSSATKILLDPEGKVGGLYEAKTTPHMYVINKEGTLVYQGAIDDKSDADQESVKTAKNYVAEALDATLAGKKVAQAVTKSYGCSVKY